jgi:hypothetical protein
MLTFNWFTKDILEVREDLMSFHKTDTTFWYYDTKNLLVNVHGKQNEKPVYPMSESSIKWMNEHHIPNAKKQIEQRAIDKQKRKEIDALPKPTPLGTVSWRDYDENDKLVQHKPVSLVKSGIKRILTNYNVDEKGDIYAKHNDSSDRKIGELCGNLSLSKAGKNFALENNYI